MLRPMGCLYEIAQKAGETIVTHARKLPDRPAAGCVLVLARGEATIAELPMRFPRMTQWPKRFERGLIDFFETPSAVAAL